jgi:hypothetical protein
MVSESLQGLVEFKAERQTLKVVWQFPLLFIFLETGSYHLPSCAFACGPYPRKD